VPHNLELVPAQHRDPAHAALVAAFGGASMGHLEPVTGGASGALAYRVDVAGKPYLLRLETRRGPLRNPVQNTCMQIAAQAGIAPPLRLVDDAAGIAIMDFLPQRPLSEYPGGADNLARAAGSLLARLQAIQLFPQFLDYFSILNRMLGFLRSSNMFASGLLDPHMETFERIQAVYPRDAAASVSSHNDPNPRNIIFDGSRLWLIDWETAYRNDPLVDVAIMLDQLAATPGRAVGLLHAWLGREPDAALRARLVLMRPLTRLYYAGLALSGFAAAPRDRPDADLSAPSPAEFFALLERGQLARAAPETLYILGKMQLAGFLSGVAAPGFADALAAIRGG
jgi:Ser/Thr protein kinase RdoA (MazF antagonist)